MHIAIITGITGQDGSYLAELLLKKEYTVYGLIRRASSINTKRIEHIRKQLNLRYGDLSDKGSLISILSEAQTLYLENDQSSAIEIYNLAAQSHVKISFDMPEYTTSVDAMGTLSLLEAIRVLKMQDYIRFYQASTSEMFGKVQEIPQSESTPFYPQSPYGVAKLYSYWIVRNYRDSYGMHASNGILFNHESPRRGINFVTRKITYGIRQILNGSIECIYLGNIYAKRDWGHARDYVNAMWLMLQQDIPDDYVVSTGNNYTVKEFIDEAFRSAQMPLKWSGQGVDEIASTPQDKIVIRISKKYFRPSEVDILLGDNSKIKKQLGWKTECSFKQLVQEMVDADLNEKEVFY
jgi:GDPmannose 4,6-dehydratase